MASFVFMPEYSKGTQNTVSRVSKPLAIRLYCRDGNHILSMFNIWEDYGGKAKEKEQVWVCGSTVETCLLCVRPKLSKGSSAYFSSVHFNGLTTHGSFVFFFLTFHIFLYNLFRSAFFHWVINLSFLHVFSRFDNSLFLVNHSPLSGYTTVHPFPYILIAWKFWKLCINLL